MGSTLPPTIGDPFAQGHESAPNPTSDLLSLRIPSGSSSATDDDPMNGTFLPSPEHAGPALCTSLVEFLPECCITAKIWAMNGIFPPSPEHTDPATSLDGLDHHVPHPEDEDRMIVNADPNLMSPTSGNSLRSSGA